MLTEIQSDKRVEHSNHFISMLRMDRPEIELFFQNLRELIYGESYINHVKQVIKDKVMGTFFFQPSTRTRISFENAMLRAGGFVSGFSDIKETRSGDYFRESIQDAICVIGQLVDLIVIRHCSSEAVNLATKVSSVPIINAGDGDNEHPTQALCDLWVLYDLFGNNLDNISIGIIGDTACRVIRSFVFGLSLFKIKKLSLLTPPEKPLSEDLRKFFYEKNITAELHNNVEELLLESDSVIMVPFHLPSLSKLIENKIRPNHVSERFCINRKKLKNIGKNIPILHCGPRGAELNVDTDNLHQSMYLRQVRDSMYVRMLLIKNIIER